MEILFRCVGFGRTEYLDAYVIRSVERATENASGALRVHVRLSDVNGPKGGLDKVCKIRTTGPLRTTVEARDADGYAAIARACDRLRRSARRWIERRTRGRALPHHAHLP